MTVNDFLALQWNDSGAALMEPPRFSPIIADPSFLFPEESSDGCWRLAAHSAWGLHFYESDDGLVWRDRGLIIRNAMRPFLRRFRDRYVLLYEKYAPLALPLTVLPRRPRWRSRIEMCFSIDLRSWSRPTVLLEPTLPWMRDDGLGASVSNPCLTAVNGGWRLYFSAGLVHIADCGFDEPRYLASAESAGDEIAGPYTPRPNPIVDPADDPSPGAIGAGSMKVLPLEDGWIGLQNKIYTEKDGRSRSALFILRSDDGIRWRPGRAEPLIQPSDGWRSSHVYACDCRWRESDGRFYLYYNARDGWYKTEGRERIGRIVSEPAGG